MQETNKDKQNLETINLFENVSSIACHQRRDAQRQELQEIAKQLREMFRTLSNELVMDRERSLMLIAEYTGILTDYASRVNRIRENRLGQGLDTLAEKLEQGLEFLIGFFIAHEPAQATWCLDRTEIKVNLQKVWPTVRQIEDRFLRHAKIHSTKREEYFSEAA